MYTWSSTVVTPPPLEGVGENRPVISDLRIIMMGYQHSEIVRSILSSLSDVSLPKLGLHWENSEERTEKKSLKNNDDLMHPYKAIIVVQSSRKMLMPFQTRNYHIRFAWNSCPGPLIRIIHHFQYDPPEQNKKPEQISTQSCFEQEWFTSSCTYVWWKVKNFNQTTFSI